MLFVSRYSALNDILLKAKHDKDEFKVVVSLFICSDGWQH